jgi:paraquat-inducible protein A
MTTTSAKIIKASVSNRFICPYCATETKIQVSGKQGRHICTQCDHRLFLSKAKHEQKILILLALGIILFIGSNLFDFLHIDLFILEHSARLLTGVAVLVNNHQHLLAVLIFLTLFFIPLIQLATLSFVMVCKKLNQKPPGLRQALGFLSHAGEWNMLDIFLLAILVTSAKLGQSASLTPGIGLFCFMGLMLMLFSMHFILDIPALWRWYKNTNQFDIDNEENEKFFYPCSTCYAVVGKKLWQTNRKCPRCGHKIKAPSENNNAKILLLIIAATLVYVPALLLPMLSKASFGKVSTDSLLSGLSYLATEGMWLTAFIVFVASIIIPIFKLVVLSYLLFSVRRGQYQHQKRQQNLLKFIRFIGRWSMIDVFVITVLAALVQFNFILEVRPEIGALAFATTVLLTMVAARSFNACLIWKGSKLA